jgi:hypothetical protein
MDLVILIILLAIVVIIFKKFSSFVYFMVIIDLFLRILHELTSLINVYELTSFVTKYIPASVPAILAKYSAGIFYTLLIWGYVIVYIIFETYIVRTFMKKK